MADSLMARIAKIETMPTQSVDDNWARGMAEADLIEDLIHEYRAAAELLKDVLADGEYYYPEIEQWLERNGVKR